MKKSLYFTLAAATLMVTACDEDYTDWAPAQVSTEGAASTVAGAVSAASPAIDAASAGDVITLLSTSAAEGCHLNLTHLYLNENTEIPFELVDGNVTVAAADLAAAVRDSYKSLAATTRELAFTGNFAMVNAQGEASPLSIAPVKVNYTTPALPANASESAYYYVGGYNGWNLAEPTPFVAKGDGIFELTITIGDSEWFAFAPQSAVDAQDWNALFRAPANGYDGTSGFLNNDPTTGWSFCCPTGGDYTFILDMVNYTWSYAPHVNSLWYAGDANGWSFSRLAQSGDAEFTGYYYINAVDNSSTWGFKFPSADNWDEPQYGAGAEPGTIAIGGGNIVLANNVDGFYKIVVNTLSLSYYVEPIATISLIGSAVAGDSSWGTDADMTYSAADRCWVYTGPDRKSVV